jgi:hypothetical protein
MNNFKKWQILSPLGLTLIGLGASLLGHSIGLKSAGTSVVTWFVWGTASLIVLNSGVAIFAEGVKARVLYELKK